MKRYAVILALLLLLSLMIASMALSTPPTLKQNVTLTPDIEVVFVTPEPGGAQTPAVPSDSLLSNAGLVTGILGIVSLIVTGIIGLRNISSKSKADNELRRTMTQSEIDLNAARAKSEIERLDALAAADVKQKLANAANLEAETKAKVAQVDAIKDQLAAEVASSLAKSNAAAFEDMRLNLASLRNDVGGLNVRIGEQAGEIVVLQQSNRTLIAEVAELKTNNGTLSKGNNDLAGTVREQGARIENMLKSFEKIKAYGDGAEDDANEAIRRDAAADKGHDR